MPFALSTQGQGSTAYIAAPSWSFNPNTNSGYNWVEIDFILHSADINNGIGYILGASSSTSFSVSVDTTNTLRFVSGSTNRIIGAAGAFVYGQRYVLRVEYNDTGVAGTAFTRMYLDGVQVGSDWTGATHNNIINQIGRYSTTRHSPITVYSIAFGSDNSAAVTYVDSWNDTTATGSGTGWTSTGGTRDLTITNATGSADSWWVSYGGAINQLSATLSSASSLSAGLTAVNRMAVSLQSISALNANLTVGTPVTNLAATLSSASALAATLTVANRMSASLASSSAVSATLTAKHKLSASLQSVSSISASLTLTSGSVVFPIDVAGIPDGTYPVALFNHETGDFVSRTNVTFVSGSAEVASVLPVGTEFSGYVIETGATPTVGAVVYGQVAYAS